MTPRAISSGVSCRILLAAPRILKAPIGCRLSALSQTSPATPGNGARTKGVLMAMPEMRVAAERTAPSETRAKSVFSIEWAELDSSLDSVAKAMAVESKTPLSPDARKRRDDAWKQSDRGREIAAERHQPSRPLCSEELELLRWVLEQGGERARSFLPQLEGIRAVRWCDCG